jgi:ABC-type dipeptide/oligopeptide/nickel transport system ATPase component
MPDEEQAEWIVPTTGALTLPAIEILTGRGFITGKSGSGKSNSASVIAEELLDNNYNLLVVDPEGEYYGLKEKYEILHVGNDDLCDVQVTPDHAEQLAEIALEQNMPIILDVSDYLDAEEASELIANVVRELFQKEKDARKPFLLMIEEMQEYLPQQGGNDELSELLERVAKRGRKRGLGMLGMSQRPSSVDKDFITQCDWMVWHRLTWQNDIDVVRKVLGSEIADQVEDLETGEGYLMTDWDENVERVKFKQKSTHDAGATPGLESYERPDLKSVSQELVQEIKTGGVSASDSDTSPDLSEEDQASLNDAVETVEAEGDAITERDPNPGSQHPDPDTDTATANEGETSGKTTDETLLQQVGDTDDEIASLDDSELRKRAESLKRRNQILEDEVAELRTVLQEVEQSPNQSMTNGQQEASSTQPQSQDASTPPSNPKRPIPPNPPVQRDGVAGNLVEFVAMMSYLFKSLTYRFRLLWYKIRYGNSGST